jgi:hypothetical protein
MSQVAKFIDGMLSHRPIDAVAKLERLVAVVAATLRAACCLDPVRKDSEAPASPLLPAISTHEEVTQDTAAPSTAAANQAATIALPGARLLGLSEGPDGLKAICGPSFLLLTLSVGLMGFSCFAVQQVFPSAGYNSLSLGMRVITIGGAVLLSISWLATTLMLCSVYGAAQPRQHSESLLL